jgi:hypothetical protein
MDEFVLLVDDCDIIRNPKFSSKPQKNVRIKLELICNFLYILAAIPVWCNEKNHLLASLSSILAALSP